MRILLTRPAEQARVTGERLSRDGHTVFSAPMLEIVPLHPPHVATDRVSALVVTSARVPEIVADRPEYTELRDRPVFAVGERTAEAMRMAGFSAVEAAAGDADALAHAVIDRVEPQAGEILYPCGRERRGDLDGQLREAGFEVRLLELYDAHKVETLPPPVHAALEAGGIDAVLIYSRRTGEAFMRALELAGLAPGSLRAFAISEAAGAPLRMAGIPVVVAQTPDEPGLLALLEA